MRIISSYHDYYDSCLSYGMDPKCIYIREEKAHKQEEAPIKIEIPSNAWFNRYDIWDDNTGIVWFCGKSYPFVIFDKPYLNPPRSEEYNKIPNRFFCYTMAQADEAAKAIFNKNQANHYFNPKMRHSKYRYIRWRTPTREKTNKFLTETVFAEKEVTEGLCKLGIPCLAIVGGELLTNPILKNIWFYKIKDAFTTFQDISMFISGVMGGQAPPMVAISDEIRKEKHGFDKWSFRKKVR